MKKKLMKSWHIVSILKYIKEENKNIIEKRIHTKGKTTIIIMGMPLVASSPRIRKCHFIHYLDPWDSVFYVEVFYTEF